jgi:U-box domain
MDIKSVLACPISLDLMDDPVTVHESGITYERESLDDSLRLYPDLEPSTGQRFGHPLHFTADVAVLQIIELVRYDDNFESIESQNAVKSLLLCPISLEVMEDPVIVHESGMTYDRTCLCTQLLLLPDREPFTNQKFDHPLHYTGSITMRKIIALLCGESQLHRHDDTGFPEQYQVAWFEGTAAKEVNVRSMPFVPSSVEVGRGDDDDENDRPRTTTRAEEGTSNHNNNPTQGSTPEVQRQVPPVATGKGCCTFATVAIAVALALFVSMIVSRAASL